MTRCHAGVVELVTLAAAGSTRPAHPAPLYAEGYVGEVAVVCSECRAVLSIGPREEVFASL